MPFQDKSKFLVTGATGLIGSCFTDLLLLSNSIENTEYSVTVVSRYKEKIKGRFGTNVDRLSIIQHDFENGSLPIDESVQFDYIVHAASPADPFSYGNNPCGVIQSNIIGSNSLLEYCVNKKTRILITSSFEVYGDGQSVWKEDEIGVIDNTSLRSCYPESKRCLELLARAFVQQYNVDCIICRLCSIYGPTMLSNDSKAHAQFIRNAINNEPIVMKSDGLQKRSYCYVIDCISAMVMLLDKGVSGETYNISNCEVITINEVAMTLSSLCNVEVVWKDMNKEEVNYYQKKRDCILDNQKI